MIFGSSVAGIDSTVVAVTLIIAATTHRPCAER
jgi:hypothetical protein